MQGPAFIQGPLLMERPAQSFKIILRYEFVTLWLRATFGTYALAEKIDNPPSPPFSKGGMGGFEIYFIGNCKKMIRSPHLVGIAF